MPNIANLKILGSAVTISLSDCLFGIFVTIMDCFADVYKQAFTNFNTTGSLTNVTTTTSFNISSLFLNEQSKLPSDISVNTRWSFIVSIIALGAFLGNISATYIPFPKKITLLITNFFFLVGISVILLYEHFAALILARILIGFGIGIVCATVPDYLTNIFSDNKSELIKIFHLIFISIGIVIGQISSFLFNRIDNWRYGFMTPIIIIFIQTFALYFVQEEYQIIPNAKASVWSLLSNKNAFKSILAAVTLHMIQQLSGIYSFFFFMSDILIKNENHYRVWAIVIGLINVLASIYSMSIVNTYERKTFLFASISICIYSLIMLVFFEPNFILVALFVSGFALGLGPIPWLITAEIFPDKYKDSGMVISASVNWIFTFLVSLFFGIFYEYLGSYIFMIYAACLVLGLIYVCFVHKETTSGCEPKF